MNSKSEITFDKDKIKIKAIPKKIIEYKNEGITLIFNKLMKKKKKKKYLFNNKIRNSTTNLKTESKNIKRDYKYKLNHINIKNFIKRIDLLSLSLTKRSKKIQRKNIINKKKHLIELNFDEPKNDYNKIVNNTFGSINEQKYKNENKRNDKKIKLSKLFIKNHNKDNYNKNFIKQTKNIRTTSNKKSDKKINIYIPKIKNKKLYESDICINKTKKTEESVNKTKKKRFKRNNTDINRLNLNLENINISQNSLNKNNNTKNIIQKRIKKKKLVLNDKQMMINISNTKNKMDKKKFSDINNVKSITKELKNYELKRDKEKNSSLKEEIIKNKKEINSIKKTKKENYKNKIPKPIITASYNTYINTNEIITNKNNNNSTKVSISQKSYIENKRHFSLDILDNRMDYSIKKTESDYLDENNKKNKIKNYLINNALINIRELSIPGRTKDGQLKLNQDSYIIQRDINYIKNFNIFAIFDGHGFNGNIISEYLKENLINKIVQHPQIKSLKNLEYIYSQFIKDNYKIIREIFFELDNELLNNEKLIDINLSGSTCILLIQIGDNIISANIGDSKAILVYEDINVSNCADEYNKYKSIKLSRDCTPYIETEKMRIIMNGGNVIQLKNSINQENGPLRIYLKGDNIPGLSITRSFGDRIGKKIGMISNPVINEYTLNKSVKFIIIASSGVWKFIKEKEILNFGIKYYLINDPDNFCNIIANKASELWKQNTGNIDDITIIVIFFTFI